MESSTGRRRGWLVPVGLALLLFAFHFATAQAALVAGQTPWTLVAPLALLVVGAGWSLFPECLPALTRRSGFVSKLDWASVVVQPAQRCPYCHERISKREDLTRCDECHTVYHLTCAREGKSCTTLGCPNFRAYYV